MNNFWNDVLDYLHIPTHDYVHTKLYTNGMTSVNNPLGRDIEMKDITSEVSELDLEVQNLYDQILSVLNKEPDYYLDCGYMQEGFYCLDKISAKRIGLINGGSISIRDKNYPIHVLSSEQSKEFLHEKLMRICDGLYV